MRSLIFFTLFMLSLLSRTISQVDYDAIALEYGERIETMFGEGDNAGFSELFQDSIFIQYVKAQNQDTNYVIQLTEADLGGENFVFKEIYSTIQGGGYYNFVTYHLDGLKNLYLVFRLFSEDGLNYHQYQLEYIDVGKLGITDIYVFTTGEYMSKTICELLLGLSSPKNHEDGSQFNHYANAVHMKTIKFLIDEGKNDQARKIYEEKLPEELQEKKVYLSIYLQLIDPVLESELYEETIDKFKELSDGNPSIYLQTLDQYYANEEFEKALASIDSIYSYTVDDFLDLYKGNIYFSMDSLEKAEFYYNRLMDNYPYLPEGYDLALDFYGSLSDINNYTRVTDSILKYISIYPDSFIESIELDYPSFRDSISYNTWKAEKLSDYKQEKRSLEESLVGQWKMIEQLDFNEMSLKPKLNDTLNIRTYWLTEDGSFIEKDAMDQLVSKGNWEVDVVFDTFDLWTEFDPESEEGKVIIESGNFQIKEEVHYQVLSEFIHRIEDEDLLLYGQGETYNVFKKQP